MDVERARANVPKDSEVYVLLGLDADAPEGATALPVVAGVRFRRYPGIYFRRPRVQAIVRAWRRFRAGAPPVAGGSLCWSPLLAQGFDLLESTRGE